MRAHVIAEKCPVCLHLRSIVGHSENMAITRSLKLPENVVTHAEIDIVFTTIELLHFSAVWFVFTMILTFFGTFAGSDLR